eukprot:gb/GECG01003185.1/.p1 GENE.gb/GECG01003185.1/~~gb/GECG01003185.1/.p1  ORF type:complete len:397 (+),score=47.86 gb/GECG01003185.1/:1-1191(+)
MGDPPRASYRTDELLSHSGHEFFTRGAEIINDDSSVSEEEEPDDPLLWKNRFPLDDFDDTPLGLNIDIAGSNFEEREFSSPDWSYSRYSVRSATVGSDMQAAWTIAEQSPGDLGDFRHTIALDGHSNSHLEKLNGQLPNDDGPLQHDFLAPINDSKERASRCSTVTNSSAPFARARSSTSYTHSSRDRTTSWGEESFGSSGVKAMKLVSPIETRQKGGTISVGTCPELSRNQPRFRTTLGQQSSEPIQDINRYISNRRKGSNNTSQRCHSSRISESPEQSSTPSTVSTAFQNLGVTAEQADDCSTPSQSPGPAASPIDSSFRPRASSARMRQPRLPFQKTRAHRPRPVKRTSHCAEQSRGNSGALTANSSIRDPADMIAAVVASYIGDTDKSNSSM